MIAGVHRNVPGDRHGSEKTGLIHQLVELFNAHAPEPWDAFDLAGTAQSELAKRANSPLIERSKDLLSNSRATAEHGCCADLTFRLGKLLKMLCDGTIAALHCCHAA